MPYNPSYSPSGARNKRNEWFANANHVQVARNQQSKASLGVGGGGGGDAARYWSIRDMNSTLSSCELAELRFFDVSGGTKLAGTFTASSSASGYGVARLNDDNLGTEWWSTTTGAGTQWVAIDLGEGNDTVVVEVQMIAADYNGSRAPRSWGLYSSNDGVNWTEIRPVVDPDGAYGVGESRIFTFDA